MLLLQSSSSSEETVDDDNGKPTPPGVGGELELELVMLMLMLVGLLRDAKLSATETRSWGALALLPLGSFSVADTDIMIDD